MTDEKFIPRRSILRGISAGAMVGGFGANSVLKVSGQDESPPKRPAFPFPTGHAYLYLIPTLISELKSTDWQQKVLTNIKSNDTGVTYGESPFYRGRLHKENGEQIIESSGEYFRVNLEYGKKERILSSTLWVEAAPTKEGESEPLSLYSEHDQKIVAALIRRQKASARRDIERETASYYFTPHESEESDLVPHPKYRYVEHEGVIYQLLPDKRSHPQLILRHTLSKVANSRREYQAYIEDRHPRRLNAMDLSEKETAILEKAIASYYGTPTPSDSFKRLIQRIGGRYRYEGFSYNTLIQFES